MLKWYGLLLLTIADLLAIRYLSEQKKKTIQCLQEMTVFLGNITYGVTEWNQTLEKAILQENSAFFPKCFQKSVDTFQKTHPFRKALVLALDDLPLPEEATELISRYFSVIGKDTKKLTEEHYRHIKNRLEMILGNLQTELPKTKKLIATGICSGSAMVAVLLL